MSKATEMAKVSAKGSFHVLWGLVVSTLISAVGTILIAKFLGEDNMGLYTIALAAPALIATFRDWGLTTAMVKYSAQYNSQNDIAKIRSIFVSGLAFEIIVGVLLTVVSISLSGFLANVFSRPAIAQLIQISSLIILTSALTTTATSAFTGMERMHLNSIMMIIQSVVKTGLIIALVLLGFGTFGAVVGNIIALLIAGITGVLLMFTIYRSLPKSNGGSLELLGTIKTMLKYGLPLSIGVIAAGFLSTYYNYIMAYFVTDNALIGNYSVAQNFVVLITFFATPVTTMLLPAFSKLDFTRQPDILKNVFQYSVKYAALIVMPITAMVMALSQPAISTIFQESYTQAPLYLSLLSVIYLFSAAGNLSMGNLINSQGDTRYNLKLTLLTVSIGFPLAFILISQLGIIGLIMTTIFAGIPSMLLGLRYIKNRYGVSVDWKSSTKITVSSAVAGILTFLFVEALPFSSPVRLVLGVLVFAVLFLFAALATRSIEKSDMRNIREIIGGLGPLKKPLNAVFDVIEKLMPKEKAA
ncbi:MAG: flippase [Candidatus Bathyarchaeota archaeon]|nr:flippase [Candidatus Bathyarchaeota archaeon]